MTRDGRGDGDGARLPLAFHPLSNGEYDPLPPSPLIRETVRRTLRQGDEHARRLGISRRDFFRTSSGMALLLGTLAACSREQAASPSSVPSSRPSSGPPTPPSTSPPTSAPGGTFTLPPESTLEPEAADEVLRGDELVIDVQTHLLEHVPGSDRFWGQGFPQASCGLGPECLGTGAWLDLVLGGSDTTIAVLSAVPVVADPDPLSAAVMERARQAAHQVGCSDRVLIQGHATPTIGELPAALEAMARTAAEFELSAWKAYTHEGPAWRLDGPVGDAFCDQVRSLGQRVICVHKGFGPAAASPADVGPAALNHPDLVFCVYHSGFEPGVSEGPYPGDEAGALAGGVDRLISSVRRAGMGPGANVYAELGSTWWNLVQRPEEAAHVLGKLLVAFGPDRILWGTDAIWYGSPQPQIEAFRAFEITDELQERFGYPALTPEVKAKILGLNAAALYGIDPATPRCTFSAEDRAALRLELPGVVPVGATTAAGRRAAFAADHPWFT